MSYIYRLKIICEKKPPKYNVPTVAIFGDESDVTTEMIHVFNRADALWMPRNETKLYGKDGATILREMIPVINGLTTVKKTESAFEKPTDPDDYRDLSYYEDSSSFSTTGDSFLDIETLCGNPMKPVEMEDDEFQAVVRKALKELDI